MTASTEAGAPRGRWRQADAKPTPGATPAAAPELAPIGIALPVGQKRGWRASEATRSAFHGGALTPFAWDEPSSGFAGRIREVRDRLALEETPGQNRKVAVLGLEPGAGASLVALNLALAAAQEKATPILVDLATGPASLSALFAPDAALGVDEVIAGASGLIRAALQDDASGVFFLPRLDSAGRRSRPTPAQMRSQLFEQMKRFDAVVIDAGSLLDGPMPHLLAELCDDIVVVAPPGLEPLVVSQRIQRALGPDAGKVRVLVTNAGAPRAVSGPSTLKAVPA
jgi:Mrp family chromosome partitioning ATPase